MAMNETFQTTFRIAASMHSCKSISNSIRIRSSPDPGLASSRANPLLSHEELHDENFGSVPSHWKSLEIVEPYKFRGRRRRW